MSEFNCLDIEFPEIDFDQFFALGKVKANSTFHAHLYTTDDEIKLKIFYDDTSYFDRKLSFWIDKMGWGKFGSYLKVNLTENNTNERLQKIDLSEAQLYGISTGSNFYENNKKFVIAKIDSVKFYWIPNEENKNTAEFYLDDRGFRVVEPFYGKFGRKSLFKNDGKFEINRMKDSNKFYQLGKSRFRPEFNIYSRDNRKDRTATITKEPKIQFKYRAGIIEEEAILYGDVILTLASFYHHIKIDYVLRRIHLPESTITIKKIEQTNYKDTAYGNLWGFELNWNFNTFLQASWQGETLKNFSLLKKAVELFNQAQLVDDSSSFLIRYNIIELCDKQKNSNEKFTYLLNKKQTSKKQKEALFKLLETITPEEHEEFKKRWESVQTLLRNKPMKNQLVSFLESQNLDPKTFPVSIKELKELRNNITHGSIHKVNAELLQRANVLLYRISGILILNLMGISDWKLNLEIN